MRIGELIRALGAAIRHGAGWLREAGMRLLAIPWRPLVRCYWRMWRWLWAAMLLLAWFACISLNLPDPRTAPRWTGPVWNYANATVDTVYNYDVTSIRTVIWNALNPTPCTTWTGPRYRTEGVPNLPPAPWTSPNPVPECFDCHGAAQWGYVNYTGMAYGGGAPVLHSR